MIFVTVGTGAVGFDELIRSMDEIAPRIDREVIMQIGNGSYQPNHCAYFDFSPHIHRYFEKAELVVTSGGIGTLFELLHAQKRIVALCNITIPDQHQDEILHRIAQDGMVGQCKDFSRLKEVIDKTLAMDYKPYQPPHCLIEQHITKFMKETQKAKRFFIPINPLTKNS